jgi:hypothetical protein
MSKTHLISCAKSPYSDLWLCDTPAFEYDAEINIANFVSINSVMQHSISLRPILLLSYYELQNSHGSGLIKAFIIIDKLFKKLQHCQKYFIIVFTCVPAADDQMKIVKNEILQII